MYILKENDISIEGIAYLFKVCAQEIMQVDKSHYLPSSSHSQQFIINPGAPGSANPRPHLSPIEINQVLEMLKTQSADIESCSTPDGVISCQIKAATPVRYYPVAIDLDGNGLEFLGFANSQVKFDVAMDGRLAKIDWINGKDGLLCYDADANGRIDNAREISFSMWDPAAGSDLRALASVFDTNKDGFLDAQDRNFAQFYIWQDRNQNGIQEDGELFQLADFAIKQIKLHGAIPGLELNSFANVLQIADVVYMNNTALPNAYDITLEYAY